MRVNYIVFIRWGPDLEWLVSAAFVDAMEALDFMYTKKDQFSAVTVSFSDDGKMRGMWNRDTTGTFYRV